MDIQSLGVIGAGQMGSGIAHVAAAAGCSVTLVDVADPLLVRARAGIEKNFDREVSKGKRTADDKRAMQLVFQTPYSALNASWTVRNILLRSVKKLTGKDKAAQAKRAAERDADKGPDKDKGKGPEKPPGK